MAGHGPVLFDRLDAESGGQIARLPGGRQPTVGYTSFLAMPLIARGAVVGCATFGRGGGRPAFGSADIALAGELASRAAVCIDNARLYERERRTAQALQHGLLPARPKVPGVCRSLIATCRSVTASSAATGTTSSRSRAAGQR
jgi:GAF domain-containing protein